MNKKRLLWIVPVALAVILLISMGIYLDLQSNNQPLPEVLSSEDTPSSVTTAPEPTEPSASASHEIESQASQPSQQESQTPSESEEESSQPSQQPSQTQPAPEESTAPTEDANLSAQLARIDELVAEVYSLRDYYVSQLAALEASAIAEYEALPDHERTPDYKQEIAMRCIDAAYALESECDSRMDAICEELSYLLLETGGSLRLVTDIRYAYASEKEAARSAFLEKYADYFG